MGVFLEKSLVERVALETTFDLIVIAVEVVVAESAVIYLAGILAFVAGVYQAYYRDDPAYFAPMGHLGEVYLLPPGQHVHSPNRLVDAPVELSDPSLWVYRSGDRRSRCEKAKVATRNWCISL